jgi:hypothetical protein
MKKNWFFAGVTVIALVFALTACPTESESGDLSVSKPGVSSGVSSNLADWALPDGTYTTSLPAKGSSSFVQTVGQFIYYTAMADDYYAMRDVSVKSAYASSSSKVGRYHNVTSTEWEESSSEASVTDPSKTTVGDSSTSSSNSESGMTINIPTVGKSDLVSGDPLRSAGLWTYSPTATAVSIQGKSYKQEESSSTQKYTSFTDSLNYTISASGKNKTVGKVALAVGAEGGIAFKLYFEISQDESRDGTYTWVSGVPPTSPADVLVGVDAKLHVLDKDGEDIIDVSFSKTDKISDLTSDQQILGQLVQYMMSL